jgi:hypothetical protein
MKKFILSSVFVLGAALAVSAQTSTETKSCHTEQGTKTCCKSNNSATTGTTTTSTTKSCCSQDSHASTTNTQTNSTGASASAVLNTNKNTEATIKTEEPK